MSNSLLRLLQTEDLMLKNYEVVRARYNTLCGSNPDSGDVTKLWEKTIEAREALTKARLDIHDYLKYKIDPLMMGKRFDD